LQLDLPPAVNISAAAINF